MEQRLLDLIGNIYDTALTHQDWLGVMGDISDLSKSETSLMMFSPKSGVAKIHSPFYGQEFSDAFFGHWMQKDPTFPAILKSRVGELVGLAKNDRDSFLKSEFYHEFWAPWGHAVERLRTNLLVKPEMQLGFGLNPHRTKDEISSELLKIFHCITPHLIRSVELQWKVHRLELDCAANSTSPVSGTLLVNEMGRILFSDAVAVNLLSEGAPLQVSNGVICARNPSDTSHLHRMIASCAPRDQGYQLRGGAAQINYPGQAEYVISILPVPKELQGTGFSLDVDANGSAIATVIIENKSIRRDRMTEDIREKFGLTRTEAAVALACMNGGTRLAIANELGVSDSTVRTHLSHIFEKTGVNRRTELIQLLHTDGILAV